MHSAVTVWGRKASGTSRAAGEACVRLVGNRRGVSVPTCHGFHALLASASHAIEPNSKQAETQSGEDCQFRLAICNATFQGCENAEGCRDALESGYTGIEIAPSTLYQDPASIPVSHRLEYRAAIAS